MKKGQVSALIFASLFITGLASGEVNEGWSFEVSPYAWLSGLDGTMKSSKHEVEFEKSSSDMLEYVEIAGSLETITRYNRFVLKATVDYFELSTDKLDVDDQPNNGDVDTDMLLAELAGGYQLAFGNNFTCDAMVGVRYLYLENELTVYLTGAEERRRNELVDPILLTRSSIGILPSRIKGLYFNLTAGIGGGGDSDMIYEIFPELRWQFGERSVLRGGYRVAGWDYEASDGGELDLDLSGLVIGFAFLF